MIRHGVQACDVQCQKIVASSHHRCYSMVSQRFAASQSKPLDSLAVHERLHGSIVDLVAQVGEIETFDKGAIGVIAGGFLDRIGNILKLGPGGAERSVPQ